MYYILRYTTATRGHHMWINFFSIPLYSTCNLMLQLPTNTDTPRNSVDPKAVVQTVQRPNSQMIRVVKVAIIIVPAGHAWNMIDNVKSRKSSH